METNTITGKLKTRRIVSNEDTYDIQTPTHNFFANDILVHNSEIILRNREFCNLTEVVIRGDDNLETLKEKVRNATILGVFQSTLVNFKYLSSAWKKNCEEERLLGVSLTGIMDNEYTNGLKGKEILRKILNELRTVAQETAKEWANKLGIPISAAITCVKPSGTVSQLVDAASGIHARHSPYYIRTVRADKKDPLAKMMVEMGFPVEDDVMKPDHTYVFSFPIKSPENAVCRQDMTAIEQLEMWLAYQRWWCEHKPSITVSVKEHEWVEVGAFVWKHFDEMSGVSFLPFSDSTYKQMPYQDCDQETYDDLVAKMPKDIDWSLLAKYETTDMTEGAQSLACTSGACDI
jgi:ribonucleoside-diphosphate reductase alpha chain